MSRVREQLFAQLRNFDDGAFEALANRGLLRRARKDLEKSPATFLEETDEGLVMGVGEHRVRMDSRGPAQATCTCPAAGICQHILAAALELKQAADSSVHSLPEATSTLAGESIDDRRAHTADSLSALHDALLAFDAVELIRHCGKAGYRWAWQFIQDLESEDAIRVAGGRHIVITLKHPRVAFRYMGGGIDSLIADPQVAQIEKYRVAAVLAYRRANHVSIQPPESGTKKRSEALDLGMDHAAPDMSAGLEDSRARLRASTKQLIAECIELGLSHLSRGIHERFTTLAVWAQGAEYYRLALMLRRVADHIELLLERAGGADEHRLLDELTIAFALVTALGNVTANGKPANHLIGKARSRYTHAGTLELLGLGASAWRSASGYVGLTMVFWCPSEQAFFSCSDARPEVQRGFNPIARYKAAGPWSGMGAPAQTTGCRVVLTNAQVNVNGRIAASESVVASIQPIESGQAFVSRLKPCTQWSALNQFGSSMTRSLLAEPQPLKQWAVLGPSRFGAPRFDHARQAMTWPIYDEAGHQLDVELPYSEFSAHAIERLEQIGTDALAPGILLVAKVRRSQSGLTAEPLSLIHSNSPVGDNPVDALHFDAGKKPGLVSDWLAKLQLVRASEKSPLQTGAAPAATPPALRDLRRWLQAQTERGIQRDTSHKTVKDVHNQIERMRRDGFTAFPFPSNANPAEHMLRLQYLCLQYEQLLGNHEDAPL